MKKPQPTLQLAIHVRLRERIPVEIFETKVQPAFAALAVQLADAGISLSPTALVADDYRDDV